MSQILRWFKNILNHFFLHQKAIEREHYKFLQIEGYCNWGEVQQRGWGKGELQAAFKWELGEWEKIAWAQVRISVASIRVSIIVCYWLELQLLKLNFFSSLILHFCRDKAIQSLQAILNKYDVEVGEERTRELEELRNALELQRKEFAVWKETIYEPQIVL